MTGILYHRRDGRSFRPFWAMAELGVDCELRVLPFPPRLAAPDFLKKNPLGTIPLFIDGATRLRQWVGVQATLGDRLLAYFSRLEARPAYQRAEARQEAG